MFLPLHQLDNVDWLFELAELLGIIKENPE